MATTATHRAGQYSTFPQERSRTEGEQRPASSACLHASAGLSTSQRWGAAGVGVHPLRRGRSVAPIPEIRPCFEARAALFPAAARPKPPRGRAGQGSHVRGAIAGVQHEPGHFGAFVQPGDAASYDSRRPLRSVGRGGGKRLADWGWSRLAPAPQANECRRPWRGFRKDVDSPAELNSPTLPTNWIELRNASESPARGACIR